MKHFVTLIILVIGWSETALADWTLNVGYQNPAVSTVGVNFLYQGGRWGFETGIGWIDVDAQTDSDKDDAEAETTEPKKGDQASVRVAGDVDVKYFFSSGGIRPFVQGGFGVGIGASAGDDSGAGAGAGGGFGGLGLFFGSGTPYGYASFNAGGGGGTFLQAGVGVDI